jgi:anaerobic ribonucleoside-triphosphate reductase activating protein
MDQFQSKEGIEGISLLGGEPFAHTQAAVGLAIEARRRGLSVMIYSGYTIEEIRNLPDPSEKLLSLTDVLVDGPFIRELPDTERRWVGSTNQRVHLLSDRYRSDDPCWRQRNTLEIRVRPGEIALNGFPASGAVGLWKPKWLRKR